MAFHVGQKVVCINANPLVPHRGGPARHVPSLVKGRVYTIARYFVHFDGTPLVHLSEILSRTEDWNGIAARRFRPIVEKKTDISIFTAMLNPKKARERA